MPSNLGRSILRSDAIEIHAVLLELVPEVLQKSDVRLSRVQQKFEPKILGYPRADDPLGCIVKDLVDHLKRRLTTLLWTREPERFTGHTDTVPRHAPGR